MEKKYIKVLDISGQILAEFSWQERERAFECAESYENMGIEVSIDEPSLPESLISSLGANQEDISTLKDEIDQEISEHDDTGCCPSS